MQLVDALTQVKQLASQAAQAGPPRPLTVSSWLPAHMATHSLEVRSKSEPDPQVVHVDAEPTHVRQLASHRPHAGPSRVLFVTYSLVPHVATHSLEDRSNSEPDSHAVHLAAELAQVRQLALHGAHAGPSSALVVTYSLEAHAFTHVLDVKFKYANTAHDVQVVDVFAQVKQLASHVAHAGPPRPLTVWNWLLAHAAVQLLVVRSSKLLAGQVVQLEPFPTQVAHESSH